MCIRDRVYWDGTSYRHLTLSEIPKYAQIHAGDTIVTTAHSSIFPPDLTIGTVESFELNNATYYDVKVRLHTDIAALNNVLACLLYTSWTGCSRSSTARKSRTTTSSTSTRPWV